MIQEGEKMQYAIVLLLVAAIAFFIDWRKERHVHLLTTGGADQLTIRRRKPSMIHNLVFDLKQREGRKTERGSRLNY
jgi:hypothetical protein